MAKKSKIIPLSGSVTGVRTSSLDDYPPTKRQPTLLEEWKALAEAVKLVPGAGQAELGIFGAGVRIHGVTLDALALLAVVVESFNRFESQAAVPGDDAARLEVTSMWMDDRTSSDWAECLVATLFTEEPGKLTACVNEWRNTAASKLVRS